MTIGGVDEVAMLVDQPGGAVELAAFFIGGEGEDQVAFGLVAFAVQAQEGGDQGGVGVLHVLGAAPVEVAVLLDKLKRIGVPVGAQGLDHVHVAEEEHGLLRRAGRRRGCGPPGSACADRGRASLTSSRAKPASRKRFCMAAVPAVTLPFGVSVVLISMSCLKISLASARSAAIRARIEGWARAEDSDTWTRRGRSRRQH